jgi:predicted permease
MESFINAGSTMVVLFITIALGYLARKLRITDDSFDTALSRVIMTITCPAMVLNAVLSNSSLPDAVSILQTAGVSALTYIFIFAAGMLASRVYRVERSMRGVHAFVISFGNTGFIGFAVCAAILGEDSVLYASIYNIFFNIFVFSVGAWMISSTGTKRLTKSEQLAYMRKNLLSPTMAACVIALVLAFAHITDSGIVGRTCSLLGGMTAPASMLVIGSTLARYQIKSMVNNGWVYITTFGRLIVAPAIVYVIGGFFLSDPQILATLTLVSAMPAAALGTVMCLTYGGDLKTMSQCTFLTTAISFITIPLVTMIIV